MKMMIIKVIHRIYLTNTIIMDTEDIEMPSNNNITKVNNKITSINNKINH